jgi:hypothetical protein
MGPKKAKTGDYDIKTGQVAKILGKLDGYSLGKYREYLVEIFDNPNIPVVHQELSKLGLSTVDKICAIDLYNKKKR